MNKTLAGCVLVSFILIASIVAAAGSSTQSRQSDQGGTLLPYPNATTGGPSNATPVTNCDSGSSVRERVNCRLERMRTHASEDVQVAGEDESCRNLNNSERCRGLYRASQRCYQMENKQKTSCFRNVIGLSNAAFREQSNKPAVREYLVLVLYEAQERVESRVKANTTTAAEGARLIDMIVDIKQSILKGESKETIKAKIQSLRTAWNEVMK